MADLRSEIEARKQRIAELRKQRGARTFSPAPSPQPAVPLTLVVPPNVHVDIPEPFLYTKTTQTSPIEGSPLLGNALTEANGQIENDRSENVEKSSSKDSETSKDQTSADHTDNVDQPDQPDHTEFRLAIASHVPPQLLTFIDDSWRAVKRMQIQEFRETPKRIESETAASSWLCLKSKTRGIGSLLAFSPFHALVAAVDSKNPRKVLISELDKDAEPGNSDPRDVDVEFSLRSPTKITGNLVFSPLAAQRVFGSGQNGQIFVWDLKNMLRKGGRYELLPQMRSPIESSAVVSLVVLGSTSLVSVNVDGILEIWASDRLNRPLHTLVLEDSFRMVMAGLRLSVIVPTALGIYIPANYGLALGYGWKVGVISTLSGHLLRLPNTATGQAHNPVDRPWKHEAAVTCLALANDVVPKSQLPASLGEFEDASTEYIRMLSGGLDWRIKLWLVPLDEQRPPRLEQNFRVDYAVASIVWHPTNPLLFAAGGEQEVQLYRLDRLRPLMSITVEHAVKQISFRGSTLAVATSETVLLYECAEEEDL